MAESGDTATGALIPVTVSDTRNTYPGWSVVGQVTDFTDAPGHSDAGGVRAIHARFGVA
ncbi:MAG TPA: hypothetical protein VHZ03_53710 [Trebonia sp.]|jgi:hypothetical protein|nr:hypothetical protein [Trebonia sp.]